MSICLDTSTVLTSTVGAPQKTTEPVTVTVSNVSNDKDDGAINKNVAKIIVNNTQSNAQQVKVVNSSVITVVNTPGPIVVKSIGPNTGSHFTLVNSTAKSPFALVNGPAITVLKNVSSSENNNGNGNSTITTVADKPLHNFLIKKSENQEIPQSHKILTANTFPQNNIVQNITGSPLKTANGQRSITGNKLKIISNVVMQGNVAGPSNILLNKNSNHRCYQQPKIVGNGATKYINKSNNLPKSPTFHQQKALMDKTQRNVYPTHKNQIKTLPPVNNYINKPGGIKTISPQVKGIPPNQIQRTGIGLKTIPPQKPPQKFPNKPNYIGKHAIQAQKIKATGPKLKTIKTSATPFNSYNNKITPNTQMTVSQALTAEILESLAHDSSKVAYDASKRYDISYVDNKSDTCPVQRSDYKPQSNLDTLSFVCQAVLLDHNYNATLPSDMPGTPTTTTTQINGTSGINLYSPGSGKRRPTVCTSNTLTSLSSTSLISSVNNNNNNSHSIMQDDDNASDISCLSDHKDSEGEETDTAPEAEAVCNDDQNDRYGDTVTRCICGFIHDDGYMIECDKCKVWQHVRCVVRNKKVPDDYLCEECDPSKPTDRQKAKLLQQQWMREVQANFRKEQMKEPITDTDSSDGEQINNNFIMKNRRKGEHNKPPSRQRKENAKDNLPRRQLKRKEKKVTKRKQKNPHKCHSDDERKDSLSNQQPFPQLRQWIENYEEAVTNHYSPELRARISNIRINGAHSDITGQIDTTVNKCKVQTLNNGIKCLVTTLSLTPGTPVIELRGKYMLSTQHRTAYGSALTTRQQRPGPFLFFYRLQKDNTEVCVDTRTYGNIARFIRRSCQPNAELKHCIEKGVLHLYIVTMTVVDKNVELTIKHESHDLAVVGTAEVPCACGNTELCTVNKIKKNGDMTDVHRKRRGRRTVSVSEPTVIAKVKEEPPVQQEVKEEPKEEVVLPVIQPEVKLEIKEEPPVPEEVEPVKTEVEVKKEEERPPSPPIPAPVSARRSSQKTDDEKREATSNDEDKQNNKKLSREERKLQAIMKAIERMERLEQRKQEHKEKQAHRRESEPAIKDDDKCSSKIKRRKRKGRARTISTSQRRRNRLDSADSFHATSSDDTLLSPCENIEQNSSSKAAGLLLALANAENQMNSKSPERICRDIDSNSNSSPETPLSSACLLVAAAVEPLEPGFKFPKTKKGLMNEWLNKGTDIQPASSISPSSLNPHYPQTNESIYETNNTAFYAPPKNLTALAQVATFCENTSQSKGNAKKRWLRQAIIEDQCDSPSGSTRPESPQNTEMVAPPKKRKLPRESLSIDSPPSTPTNVLPPTSLLAKNEIKQDNGPDTMSADSESPTPQDFNSDVNVTEVTIEEGQDFVPITVTPTATTPTTPPPETTRKGCLLDPRLSRDRLTTDQLVGTVEKTLSILGYGEKKPEAITPAKRKLSITEYRQRKKLNHNDKSAEDNTIEESPSASQSPKPMRNRSNSSSSATSLASSDDETLPIEVPEKSLSAFNSEPTELERERENLSSRLKKTYGLSVDEDLRKTAINVETLLKCDLTPPKCTLPLSSPTFPIPGSTETSNTIALKHEETIVESPSSLTVASPGPSPNQQQSQPPPPQLQQQQEQQQQQPSQLQQQPSQLQQQLPLQQQQVQQVVATTTANDKENEQDSSVDPAMFYTPDEEEAADDGKFNKIESTSYVPPFNNPLYPNNISYTTYGSVIDDDAPYEGRNPSPPPELGNV